MRVVYLNPCGQMGGAETSLRELLTGVKLAEPEWDLHLVLGEDGPLADIARQLKVHVRLLPFPPELASVGDSGKGGVLGTIAGTIAPLPKAVIPVLNYTRKLSRILRGLQADIIHTNGFKMHLLGAHARPPETALVWHIHDYVRRRPMMSRLLRYRAKSCAAVIANSNSVATEVRELFPKLKTATIYNAIDLERFSPAGMRLDLDAIAKLPPATANTVRIGLIATFARWKGHKNFLAALARIPAGVNVRGYIVGAPIYQTQSSQWSMAELQEETRRLGLENRVGFTGFLDDPAAAMRSLDVVVHASTDPEPFGMVIIEGMACGKAVIASRAGGATELFIDGEDAVGHRPGDAADLADQILRVVGDASLRKHLGEAGRAKAECLFNRHRLTQELLGLYASATGSGPRPSVVRDSSSIYGQEPAKRVHTCAK
jgi:glycosyltransferase involved in cell wall biosynthesis